jgi:hypothetical protein
VRPRLGWCRSRLVMACALQMPAKYAPQPSNLARLYLACKRVQTLLCNACRSQSCLRTIQGVKGRGYSRFGVSASACNLLWSPDT